MKNRLLRCALAVALVTSGFASPALAQTVSDKAAAEGLFDQGRAAMQEGDFNKACGLLERSQHIDPAVGTLLYLAECFEKSGRTASAWATFREAADAATAVKDTQRARTGRERAQRLEPLLSRLTIQVAPETQQLAGLVIDQRDKQLQPALFNVPVPTDPGEYPITATAPGYESWKGTVTVPEKAGRVSIVVPQLKKGSEADAIAAAGATPPPAGSTAPEKPAQPQAGAPDSSPSAAQSKANSQRTMGLIVGAAGIVGVGIGTYFGLRAISKNSDAQDHCPASQCKDQEGVTLTDEARSAATAANIAFGVGLAALAGGVVLYLTAPSGQSAAQNGTLQARVGLGSISLGGTFR
jgi:serine/threonine-protein kinase